MYTRDIVLTALSLFVGILFCMEAGRLVGLSQIRKRKDQPPASLPAVEGSVFGLMGLLIAFTFSSAAARFEARRQILVQEAAAIGTAWRRGDLLPETRQGDFKDCLRKYVDTQIAFTRAVANGDLDREAILRAKELQRKMWAEAVSASKEGMSPAAAGMVLGSMNAISEMGTVRLAAAENHLPLLIRAMLIVLPLICAVMAGMSTSQRPQRSWLHMFGFAAIIAITIYVILDLEYPRAGLIRLDKFDQATVELRKSME